MHGSTVSRELLKVSQVVDDRHLDRLVTGKEWTAGVNAVGTQEEDGFIVRLADTLDITGIDMLHAELRAAMESGAPIRLHGADIARIDTAAMQVLVSMFLSAELHKRDVEWCSCSVALMRTATLLGTDRYLRLSAEVRNDAGPVN